MSEAVKLEQDGRTILSSKAVGVRANCEMALTLSA